MYSCCNMSTGVIWLYVYGYDCSSLNRWFLGRVTCTQCKCSLLLQMLHVAWSMCLSACVCPTLYVGHTGELCKNGWTDRDAVWGLSHVGPSNNVLDGVQVPHPPAKGRGTFEEEHLPSRCNVRTHGEWAWLAHAADECMERRMQRRCGLLPN